MPLTTTLSESGRYDIVIEQPPVNAFSIGLLRDLTEAARSLPPQARVVVLRSNGRGFCAGGGPKEGQALPSFPGALGRRRYSPRGGTAKQEVPGACTARPPPHPPRPPPP